MIANFACTIALLMANQVPEQRNGPPVDKFTPDASWRDLDKANPNCLFFDAKERRLILRARVCVREGYLEHFLCSDRTKEHESIFATKANARMIHAGLLLTEAEIGHAVKFLPKFQAPAGSEVSLTVEWAENGKTKSVDGKELVQDAKTKKPLEKNWVFAGSEFFEDPNEPKKVVYAADNSGDLFTVANFTSAILDVPFASSAEDASRSFMANPDKLPPVGTYVTIIVRPIKPAK